MKNRSSIMLFATALFLNGCASTPQQPVSLSHDAIGLQAGRVGVAMTALPKIDTQFPGAGCLLCLAAASVANSSLTTHSKTLSYEDLPQLKAEMANLLRKKGADVTVIEESLDINSLPDSGTKEPNAANKNFSSLQKKYNINQLLVIDVTALGFIRTYASYIPTSDPKGVLQGKGYIVNLKNNTYEWYQPVVITKSAEQNWDEPPNFPGLTNAYFQAIAIGKENFLQPFTNTVESSVKQGAISVTSTHATTDEIGAKGAIE